MHLMIPWTLRQYQTSRLCRAAIVIGNPDGGGDHCPLPYQNPFPFASPFGRAANTRRVNGVHAADLLANLLLAAVLGGAVGIQRQAAQKPAGFRTHLLVALACCAFAEIGRLSGDSRITANVLTGIGFIGAGAIFRSGLTAHGLTTAASLWTVAAIGVTIGFGGTEALAIGVAVTVVTLIALCISDTVFTRLFIQRATLHVVYAGHLAPTEVTKILERHVAYHHPVGEVHVSNTPDGPVVDMQFEVGLRRGERLSTTIYEIAQISGVMNVRGSAPPPVSP